LTHIITITVNWHYSWFYWCRGQQLGR